MEQGEPIRWPVDRVQIKEVIKPADQGFSRPFLCRGVDNDFYYVKGRNTTPDSMYKEWICAHLATALALPIPEFRIVELDPELVEALSPDLAPISGPAFGSRKVPRALWLEPASVNQVPAALQRRVVAFDWWIRNSDRTLHNPNLLFDQESLVVFDHNNAFDTDFDPEDFLANHIFKDEARNLFSDYIEREFFRECFERHLPIFDEAFDTAPPEWKWYDSDATVPGNFAPRPCKEALENCLNRSFWNIP